MKLLFSHLKHTSSLYLLSCLAAGLLSASCASYRQNIMFTVEDPDDLRQEVQKTEKNYIIRKNDYLRVDVYTNKGERIIDPDMKLAESANIQAAAARPDVKYLVDVNGVVKLPMIGELKVEGLTVRETEAILQSQYEKFYTEPYATVTYVNKRVVVLGTAGGVVVPLENENTRLAEVLALSKAINNTAKVHNMRVIRSEKVFVVNFGTMEGYLQGNMIMEPGDIIYVEPVRKPLIEAVRDYGPVISILTSVVTLIAILTR